MSITKEQLNHVLTCLSRTYGISPAVEPLFCLPEPAHARRHSKNKTSIPDL